MIKTITVKYIESEEEIEVFRFLTTEEELYLLSVSDLSDEAREESGGDRSFDYEEVY